MKRFISTEFLLLLKEASRKHIEINPQVLENKSDEFTVFLFAEYTSLRNT
ncbi:MAG: hypothetical protein QM654_05795 [Dysgonamonadaceae bacterium]